MCLGPAVAGYHQPGSGTKSRASQSVSQSVRLAGRVRKAPRTKIRWAPGLRGARSDKPGWPGCTLSLLAPSPLSCSCLFEKFVRGPDCRERKGQGTPFLGGNPTPAHAHFAELGLAPRPEGKEPSRLKASKDSGAGAIRSRLLVSAGCLLIMRFLSSYFDFIFSYSNYYYPVVCFLFLPWTSLRRFYRPHEISEGSVCPWCALGVHRRKEKSRGANRACRCRCRPMAPAQT